MKKVISFWPLVIIIVGLAFFLRIYKVADTPHDLYVDEAAIGWNAYSILKTGRDEYGAFLPLAFRSYGEYKLPVYIYFTTLSEAIFGKTAFAIRFPAVVFGTATIFFLIMLTKSLTGSQKFALLAGLILAISPWHLQFTRAGFEASVALFWIVCGIYLILSDIYGKRRTFFWGVACLVVSLYTYNSARIAAPLLLLSVIFIYHSNLKQIVKRKHAQLASLLLFVVTVPFIIYAFTPQGLARARSEWFWKDMPKTIQNSVVSSTVWKVDHWFRNYLAHFSVDYLFFVGDGFGRHGVREMGGVYLWQLPLVLFGLAAAFKKPTRHNQLMFTWMFISPIAASFVSPNPQAVRGLPLVIPLTYFSAYGLYNFLPWLVRFKWLAVILSLSVGFFLLSYLHIYYVHYPNRTSPDWSGGYKESKYDQIALTKSLNQGYAYLYFYGDFDPYLVNTSPHPTESYGKYTFVTDSYIMPPHSLYVAQRTDPGNGGHKVSEIKNKSGDVIYNIWEN